MHKPLLAGLASASIGAAALVALAAPPAAAAAPPARSILYKAGENRNVLSAFDANTHELLTYVGLDDQAYATDVTAGLDGRLVFATTNNAVMVVDTATNAVVRRVPVATPTGTELTPDGSRVVAVSQDGRATIFPAAAAGDITVVDAGQGAQGVAFSPDSRRAYVSNNIGVAVIDLVTAKVLTTVAVPAPGRPIAAPDGKHVYVPYAGTGMKEIDTATNTVTRSFDFPYIVQDHVFAPNGHLYVATRYNSVVVLETATFTVLKTVPVEGIVASVALTPGGDQVLAGVWNTGMVSVIDTATDTMTGSFGTGPELGGLAFASVHPAAPTANLKIGGRPDAGNVTFDASGSAHGFGTVLHYRVDFGDGTAAVDASVGNHQYEHGGAYTVTLTVTDNLGVSSTDSKQVTVAGGSRTIALLGRSALRYVSAENNGAAPLVANRTAPGAWESFDQVDVGGGNIALRAGANGRYLTVDGSGRLIASGAAIADAARFRIVPGDDGVFALQSVATGKYVSTNNGGSPMTADRAAIGPWEQLYAAVATNVTFKAHANDRFVTAESGGERPLTANRTATGPWESFDRIDAGNGYIALFSRADNRFVTAEAGGNQPLIANRTAVGAWEKFRTATDAGGYLTLQANANGRYVTAEAGGAQPLIANRTAVGNWEQFTA